MNHFKSLFLIFKDAFSISGWCLFIIFKITYFGELNLIFIDKIKFNPVKNKKLFKILLKIRNKKHSTIDYLIKYFS